MCHGTQQRKTLIALAPLLGASCASWSFKWISVVEKTLLSGKCFWLHGAYWREDSVKIERSLELLTDICG